MTATAPAAVGSMPDRPPQMGPARWRSSEWKRPTAPPCLCAADLVLSASAGYFEGSLLFAGPSFQIQCRSRIGGAMAIGPKKTIASAEQRASTVDIRVQYQARGAHAKLLPPHRCGTCSVPGELISKNDAQVAVLQGSQIIVYDKDCDVNQQPVSSFNIHWHHLGDSYELAARCAVGSCFVTEQMLNKQIQGVNNPDQLLRGEDDPWFDYWSVRRTFRKSGDREGIRQLLFDARRALAVAQPHPDGWQLVDELSREITRMNCNSRPTSLVSKFAFSCCPTTFAPYDSLVRATLRQHHPGLQDHDYVGYMSAFLEEKTRIANVKSLTAAHFRCHGNVMPQPLFELRTADWYFLLQTKEYSFGVKRKHDDNWNWVNQKGAAVHLAHNL
jgi:hypothetical protein